MREKPEQEGWEPLWVPSALEKDSPSEPSETRALEEATEKLARLWDEWLMARLLSLSQQWPDLERALWGVDADGEHHLMIETREQDLTGMWDIELGRPIMAVSYGQGKPAKVVSVQERWGEAAQVVIQNLRQEPERHPFGAHSFKNRWLSLRRPETLAKEVLGETAAAERETRLLERQARTVDSKRAGPKL